MTRPTREQIGFAASTIWFTIPAPGSWTEDGECRRHPGYADLFTDAQSFEQADLPLTICADCPVAAQCLAYGQSLRADGVWGGELLKHGSVQRRLPYRRAS
jgi:hypothetical protein